MGNPLAHCAAIHRLDAFQALARSWQCSAPKYEDSPFGCCSRLPPLYERYEFRHREDGMRLCLQVERNRRHPDTPHIPSFMHIRLPIHGSITDLKSGPSRPSPLGRGQQRKAQRRSKRMTTLTRQGLRFPVLEW